MRHTSLLGQPNPVYLLPPGVVFPAPLRLLIPAAGLPHRLFSCLTTAGIRAVPLPTIAVRAHHHLASASVAAQQSSVARGPAADLLLSSGLSLSLLSASKPDNRPQLLSDNYSCASHTGRCRRAHDRSSQFSTSIDDAIQSHQTAG